MGYFVITESHDQEGISANISVRPTCVAQGAMQGRKRLPPSTNRKLSAHLLANKYCFIARLMFRFNIVHLFRYHPGLKGIVSFPVLMTRDIERIPHDVAGWCRQRIDGVPRKKRGQSVNHGKYLLIRKGMRGKRNECRGR